MSIQKPIECLLDYKSKGYELGKYIGGGDHGRVFLCQKIDEQVQLVIKIIQMSANEEERNAIMEDFEVIKKFDHRNIIRYIDAFFITEKYFCIITEYA